MFKIEDLISLIEEARDNGLIVCLDEILNEIRKKRPDIKIIVKSPQQEEENLNEEMVSQICEFKKEEESLFINFIQVLSRNSQVEDRGLISYHQVTPNEK